jgi:hypothetical protein
MKAGNVRGHGLISGLVTIMLLVYPGLGVLAQTSESTCANDSLFLISPDAVLLQQQYEGRPGLTLSWADLSLDDATCFVLTGQDTLDYDLSVEGGFGGFQDRQLLYTTTNSGTIGSHDPGELVLDWISEGSPLNGILSGTINLANNGGVLSYSEADGQWTQSNAGLPMNLQKTNVLALDVGSDGVMLAALSAGVNLDTRSKGLYSYDGTSWQRIAPELFPDTRLITRVSVSAANSQHFAVGTSTHGLYVTTDGGLNFVQWSANLDETVSPPPTTVRIDGLNWKTNRLWVSASNFGLFYSTDTGSSFTRSNLLVEIDRDNPDLGTGVPVLTNQIVINRSDADHILVALDAHGAFQSFDGGQTWSDTYGNLQNVIEDNPGAWRFNAMSVLVDPDDPNTLVVAMKNRGIYRSVDSGVIWTLVGAGVSNPEPSRLFRMSLLASDRTAGTYYCFQDEWSLLVSSDYGTTWAPISDQPSVPTGTRMINVGGGSGNFVLASYGGGIFEPGSTLALSDTYNTGTSSHLRNLDLGLDITIGAGEVIAGPQFGLKCQTFQGWAVWRALNSDPDEMVMIGLYDRSNPESCIEGYCGDMSFEVIPQCYNSKRAACFNFDTPDSIRFFDEEIYNGYAYFYAVTTYDYGNTALSSAENNSQIPVYSPRWENDTLSPYVGPGNRTHIQLNDPATEATIGEEIYVFPNPLRADAGIPGQEGETVVFTKLPPGSRVRVFTPAGDDVIDLGPETLQDGNIYWGTRNREQERISAGVYLYKVVMPEREDYWGRLVIIR